MNEALSLELEIAAREVLYHLDNRTYLSCFTSKAFTAAKMRLSKAVDEVALFRREASSDIDEEGRTVEDNDGP